MTDPSATDVARLTALIERQRQELDALHSAAAARSLRDLATGMLMEQLGCSPAQARRQLGLLAAESASTEIEMAAQVTREPPPRHAGRPDGRELSAAWAVVESAADGAAVAAALLDEVLKPAGAAAVAIWLTEPDGGLELVGEAGFGAREASLWRRIPPQMAALPQLVARQGEAIWWPSGRPADDDTPLIGQWPGGARAVLPLREGEVLLGAMVVCWTAPLLSFSTAQRRELAALADLTAQAIGARLPGARLPGGGFAAEYRTAWIYGLLDDLFDTHAVLQPVRDDAGTVLDLRLVHVSAGYRDVRGRAGAELTGRRLFELYPAEVSAELFDRCVSVLATGEPYTARWLEGSAARSRARPIPEVRIVPLYDGIVVGLREADASDRLAALLQHAQRLGRIGSWEEDLATGELHWSEQTFALFGMPAGDPVPLAELDAVVAASDLDALQMFRHALLQERIESAAAFRITRADDGSVRQLRAYAEPVVDAAGTLIAIRGAYQDVSADYHARLAFAAAREQLADVEERAAEEHRLAIRLQQAITPRSADPVEAAGLEVAARYRPSGQSSLVGGDWYDTVVLPGGDVLLVVGDVAGHGMDAVTGMVAMRNALRGLAITGAGPATLLRWLNNVACHYSDGVIGTAICGRYDPATRSLCWARAGHLPPVLVRDGKASTLDLPQGMLFGADTDAAYTEVTTTLTAGDTLLFFTDGLIERRDEPIDDAISALMRIAGRGPVEHVAGFASYIVAEAPSDTDDDACLVAVRVV